MITSAPCISGTSLSYSWNYQGKAVRIAYETRGDGAPILLLPALSTVSSREEMAGIAEILAAQFQVWTLDWPGFGDSDRLPVEYAPLLYRQLLQDFVRDCLDRPVAIVAAGHAAGYAMRLAAACPSRCSALVLVAPTWKGPLRAMGAPRSVAETVKNLVRSPFVGQTLYTLNTVPAFLRWMYQRHVYVESVHLTAEFMAHKHDITQQPGARFAPAAFVTGALDPMTNREEWLEVGRLLTVPTLVILAENSPPQSQSEMNALATLPAIQSQSLRGSLGLHEEYGQEVGAIALSFLQNEGRAMLVE